MAFTSARLFWHALFVAFLIVYIAVIATQLGHGLASLDAHAIVKVTREFVDQHRLEVSRPPGHPTTEVYLFPAVAWLLRHAVNIEFDEKAYLVVQSLAGVAALCLFYSFLLRMGAAPWKALLASVCFGLSAQFFFNTIDGEEFVLAVLFLTLSLHFLIDPADSPLARGRLFAAICSFAVATGCRPEVIFAGFLFPLYGALHPKSGWRQVMNILLVEALAVAAVWFPILLIGLRPPYTAGMNVVESVLGGGYRLAFQCFTLPVFVLICWVLFRSFCEWRRHYHDAFPGNFLFVACCVTPIIFFAALFLHASKPAHVLFALPFVLILAVRRSAGLLIAWAIATVIGFFVTIDIFKERQLTGPHLVAGSYFEAIRQKPFYKLEYLQQMLQQCGTSRTAVIADLWRWDIEYHIAHGTFAVEEEQRGDLPVFGFSQNDGCVLLPRDAALHQDLLEDLRTRGYVLKMDATLYRTLFARYNVITPGVSSGRIGNATVQLFPITAPWR